MGSTEVPSFSSPGYNMDYTVGANVEGGNDMLTMAKNLMNSKGLPEHIRKLREQQGLGAIAGARKSGLKDMRGAVGNGAAVAEGFAGINENLTRGTQQLYGNLAEMDYNAQKSDRQEGFGNFGNLIQMAMQGANSKNQLRGDMSSRMNDYNMTKYQIDESNRFKFGDALGGLMGAAGQIGGAAASKGGCCFIFMEAYNGRMPWWVRECRNEFAPDDTLRRRGYIKMSKWLVPLMSTHPGASATPLKRGIRFLVNVTMIKPLTIWGGWYKNVKGYRLGWMFKPVVNAWFKLWEWYGRPHPIPSPEERGVIRYA